MADFSQALPSEVSVAGDFARQLARLIGPAYQPADGTAIAADLLAIGGALAAARASNLGLLNEAFPDTALQLLPEWEVAFGIPDGTGLSTATRQARVAAAVLASFLYGSPQGIQGAMRAIDPSVTVKEWTISQITAAFTEMAYLKPNP